MGLLHFIMHSREPGCLVWEGYGRLVPSLGTRLALHVEGIMLNISFELELL